MNLSTVLQQHPTDVIKFPNQEAVFACIASNVDSFHWKVNGTHISSELRDDINIIDIYEPIHFSTLTIRARVAYIQWN